MTAEPDAELEALQRNAQDLFRDVVSHSPQLSDDLHSVAANIDDPGRLGGLHRRHAAVAVHPGSPGTDRDAQRSQAAGSVDSRTFEGTRSSRAALQDSRTGSGASQPEPARILAARADEGDSEGTRRIRRFDAGNRRAPQKSGRSRHDGGSQERVRSRTEAAAEDDAGFGGVHGVAHVPGMDDVAAVEQIQRAAKKSTSPRARRFSTKITTTWRRSRSASWITWRSRSCSRA